MSGFDHFGHDGSESGDGTAAQVVPIGEPSGQDHGLHVIEAVVAVPQRHRLAPAEPDCAERVLVVKRAWESDNTDLWANLRAGVRTHQPACVASSVCSADSASSSSSDASSSSET